MHAQLSLDAGFPEQVDWIGVPVDEPPEYGLPICYETLERAMLAMPQVPLPTTHHFGPGTYLRQMHAAADTLVLGREHRGACMNIMLRGRCVLIDSDGSTRELVAPQMFVSPPGRKLAYVIEDMTWVNIWATEQTDVAELEKGLFL